MTKLFNTHLKDLDIKFETRPGVFSSHGLDSGTELLLENLEVRDETLIADLGCGTGVIGILAAKLNYHGHVHLLDDHLRAINLAKENLELNDLRNAEVYLSDLFSSVPNRTYHQIISNPPASLGNEFLEELISESFNHLKPQGFLWLVVTKNIKPAIERMLKNSFKSYIIVAQGKEHVVIKTQRKGDKSQVMSDKVKKNLVTCVLLP